MRGYLFSVENQPISSHFAVTPEVQQPAANGASAPPEFFPPKYSQPRKSIRRTGR